MQNRQSSSTILGAIPPVVQALLAANVVMFLVSNALPIVGNSLALWPLNLPPSFGISFQPWQLISYGFLHGNFGHLFFNMFAVWMFGSQLERLWGSKPFLLFYMVCVVGAGLVQLMVNTGGNATVGASGGVFGLLLGYGMMYPNNKIIMIFFPVPIAAKYFVVLYGLAELWMGFNVKNSTIAHFAHLGGMLFGLILILYWRGKLPFKPRRQLNR